MAAGASWTKQSPQAQVPFTADGNEGRCPACLLASQEASNRADAVQRRQLAHGSALVIYVAELAEETSQDPISPY